MSNKTFRSKKSPTIIGAGLIVLDAIINNGAKVPIFRTGGTCGNVLAGLSFLGWKSTSVSRTGMDIAGEILVKDLSKNGVNVSYITKEKDLETPRIIERLKSNGRKTKHSFLLRCPTCHTFLPRFRSPRLDAINDILVTEKIPDVYFFDRVTPATLKLAGVYRDRGALIFFEPSNLKYNAKLEEAIRLSHILKFSDNEENTNLHDIKDIPIMEKIKSYVPNLIIRTLGEAGLFFSFKGSEKWQFQKSFELGVLKDSCGAGDWCTVGFLFHLQELAIEHNISLLDVLDKKILVKKALVFAQKLASLSCGFIGARGLPNSLDKKRILKTVSSCTKINLPIIKDLGKNNNVVYIKKKMDGINLCPTCLSN